MWHQLENMSSSHTSPSFIHMHSGKLLLCGKMIGCKMLNYEMAPEGKQQMMNTAAADVCQLRI